MKDVIRSLISNVGTKKSPDVAVGTLFLLKGRLFFIQHEFYCFRSIHKSTSNTRFRHLT